MKDALLQAWVGLSAAESEIIHAHEGTPPDRANDVLERIRSSRALVWEALGDDAAAALLSLQTCTSIK